MTERPRSDYTMEFFAVVKKNKVLTVFIRKDPAHIRTVYQKEKKMLKTDESGYL